MDRDQEPGAIRFQVSYEDLDWPFEFTLTPTPSITPIGWSEDDGPIVSWEGDEIPLPEFLRVIYPTFYFPDFSSLRGADYLEAVTAGMFFESDRVETIDWTGVNVDIRSERKNPKAGMISIHTYLINKLGSESHRVVVYDDGTGEVADFVAIDESDTEVRFTFYHAKGSKSSKPGERLADVYEVCGQAVKSIHWTWKVKNKWGWSLVFPKNVAPSTKTQILELEPRVWKITLAWSQEALNQAAFQMTFWFMAKVGESIYRKNNLPSELSYMKPSEAGENNLKQELYYISMRPISQRQSQLAVKLYNVYGYGYALGVDAPKILTSLRGTDWRGEILWPEDIFGEDR